LVEKGVLHPECARIFRINKSDTDHSGRRLLLHEHQRAALGVRDEDGTWIERPDWKAAARLLGGPLSLRLRSPRRRAPPSA
jgi:hypothetical protein